MKAQFETIYPDKKTSINKIKFSAVEKFDFIKLNDPTETIEHYYSRATKKPDIIINAGLYTFKTGKNILSFIEEGKEQNYDGHFDGFGIKQGEDNAVYFGNSSDKGWRDFMSAYPVLIKDGVATTKESWGNASSINYYAPRQAIGFDDEYFYIVTVDVGCYFKDLQKIFLDLGVKYAINLDGGGSVKKLIGGVRANNPSDPNRAIDNAFQVFLKELPDEPFKAGNYKVNVGTNSILNVRAQPNTGYEIIGTLRKDDEIVITELANNNTWGKIDYNGKTGYVSMDYVIRISDYEPEHWAKKYLDKLVNAGVITDTKYWEDFDASASEVTIGQILALVAKAMDASNK